jgi:glycosyltransferase involved in cell wall biosynthesis
MKLIIYCGDSWEAWAPPSVKTGIGGSEEAVINISAELTKLGHTVVVYNRCEDMAGEYDGVKYIDYLEYEGEPCDVFIGWRAINPWKVAKNFEMGYHWLHDTTPEETVGQILDLGAHRIMVLSHYHRRLYPQIPGKFFFITQNGVNLKDFDQKVERVKGQIFYGSSYDRGLKELLEMWTEIKLANPEATLRIAYGTQTIDKMIENGNEGLKNFKENIMELLEQEGVTHLGRISHEEVAKEMLQADIWAYPTWWPEISCITAMKAQIGGAVPVIIPTAAVAETVKYGYKTDRGYYTSLQGSVIEPEEARTQFLEQLNKALTDPTDEYRKEMMGWAREHFDWKKVARDWIDEFERMLPIIKEDNKKMAEFKAEQEAKSEE